MAKISYSSTMARLYRLNRPKTLLRVLRWLPVAGWLALLYVLSSSPLGSARFTGRVLSQLIPMLPEGLQYWLDAYLPALTFAKGHFLLRKGAHVLVFGMLTFLLWWAIIPWRRAAVAAWFLATLTALADEWHQAKVPGRTGQLSDVILDSIAALLVAAVLSRLHPAPGGQVNPARPASKRPEQ